jgi:hypothetical protein
VYSIECVLENEGTDLHASIHIPRNMFNVEHVAGYILGVCIHVCVCVCVYPDFTQVRICIYVYIYM